MKTVILTTIILLSNLMLNLPSQAQCHMDDWTALKAFYESTNGDNWKNNEGWEVVKQSSPPEDCDLSDFFGIELDDSGRVNQIDLNGNYLKGNLPHELGNLSKLILLNLDGNYQLIGAIPREIGQLTNLVKLNLHSTQFVGSIPPELGNLSKLEQLFITYNNLTGYIPPELGNLNNLTSLNLTNNELNGNIPSELGNLSRLTYLNLERNLLNGNIPPEIGNLINLTELDLRSNQLSGGIPAELGNLSYLVFLDLSHNQLINIPKEIGNLNSLKRMWLSSNHLSGSIPPELANLSNLRELRLSSNQLNGSIPPELENLSNLIELILSTNQLSGSIPPELGNLGSLTSLNLSDNQLDGSIPPELGNLSKLNFLFLGENNISGNLPSQLGNLTSLTSLDFRSNRISGSIPPDLGNLKNLEYLWLSNNLLSGRIPSELGDLKKLSYVGLSNNELTGEIPKEISNLTNIWGLDLSNNQLTSFASELTNMNNLGRLNLSNNGLTGSIPNEIGNMSNLYELNLSNNQLSGNVISSLSNLSNLRELHLNNNNLNGALPTELIQLYYLEQFDVSNNSLSGPFSTEILPLCDILFNAYYENIESIEDRISLENNFDESWASFCAYTENINKCHIDDWEALNALYNATSGENWSRASSWTSMFSENSPLQDCNLSHLTGVGLDRFGRVYSLDLRAKKLEGSLPVEFGKLVNLRKLDLSSNDLTGSILPITNLSKLTILNLNSNDFNESIPPQIGGLTNLIDCDLSENQINDIIPPEMGNLNKLTKLNLSENNLSGIPPEMGNLSNLNELNLSSNNLSGIPAEMGNLNNLIEFNLSNNNLSSIPLEIGNLSKLIELNLSKNNLSILPSEIGNLSKLSILKLHYNQLNGSISIELANLNNLTELYLSYNLLSNSIPPEIGNLSNLSILNLSGNQLDGSIPVELGNLNNLIELDLSRNQLSNDIPADLGNLSKLSNLDLHYNQLNGNIPSELGNLSNLEYLDLEYNQLNGSIPVELSQLSNLKILNLSGNELNGSLPPELGNLEQLTELLLDNNQLNESIPPKLGELNNLVILDLGRNQLNGVIPAELGNLNRLVGLNLTENTLEGSIPDELGDLSNLSSLYLSNNQLSGSIPAKLGNLYLSRLDLDENELSGCYDENLTNLCDKLRYSLNENISDGNKFEAPWEVFCAMGVTACDNSCHINDWNALKAIYQSTDGDNWNNKTGWDVIKENSPSSSCNLGNLYGVYLDNSGRVSDLSFYNNQLSGFIPAEIGNLNNLVYLRLYKTQLSGNIPVEIGNLSKLKSLQISETQVSGNIPNELGNLNNLEYLRLNRNQLEGNIPIEISYLTKLEYLELASNKLVGGVPSEIGNLDKLTALGLNANSLNGNIPVELDNLHKLTYLDLSSNQLSDAIPDEIGSLNNLTKLNLQNNQLSGRIPTQLGNLSNLIELDLSNNQLSGSIPAEIGNLSTLTELSLYSNQLSGGIPIEIGNLSNLGALYLNENQLTGNISPSIGSLSYLRDINLSINQLSGGIPLELDSLINLKTLNLYKNKLSGELTLNLNNSTDLRYFNIGSNYFSCQDIQSVYHLKEQIQSFTYSPQIYKPVNYNDIKTSVIDYSADGQGLALDIDFPWSNINDLTFEWKRNSNTVGTDITYTIDNLGPFNSGKYTLHVHNENCLPDGSSFEVESEPIYIIVKGYDLYGQPVDYTQLMVEFEDQAAKDKLEQEVILDNGGIWMDKCDCNRELHLYDFPNDSSSIEQAYIAIDQKIKDSKIKSELDGGFNYKLNNIGLDAISTGNLLNTTLFGDDENGNEQKIAYTISLNSTEGNFTDDVNIYMLDSGLDQNNMANVNSFLYATAPVDLCYNISAPGYNFSTPFSNMTDILTPININYQDNVGHGTFGFNIIAEGLEQANNTKIVPLKVIEQATDGSLFDLLCAMYHAVDHNANVINISAGYRGEPSGIMENALYEAREKGIFVVAAAGNDGLNIDDETIVPQYPAYYASQYHKFYTESTGGGSLKLDSVPYNNVISVANVNVENELNEKSNYGINSVTIAAPGEDIFSYGLEGAEVVGNGTSFSAFLTTQVLAKEIARDSNRSIEKIWQDFETQYLVGNPNLNNKTSTGKQIDFSWQQKTNIEGCTDCTACNYWPYATVDDGSCTYCSAEREELACANGDFEECPPCVFGQGCTDIAACNYNPAATINDGSCLYGNNCGNQIDIVSCPANEATVICSPVSTTALSLEDFVTTGNVTLLSNLSLRVIEKTDNYKYYNTTTYDYIISDGAGNQSTCQSKYYIATQFLQAPEITYSPQVCEDDLWSYLKLGGDEYKIYEDENGSKGEELTVCNMPYCSTYGLGVDTATPGMHQFWVSQFFTFPDGSICESEASLFQMFIEPKPTASLSTQNININIGENIALMDVVMNNTSGYWSGKNIIHLTNANGENIAYFSANTPGLFKLYYTVSNTYCDQRYLLIANVGASVFANKETDGFVADDYQINKVGLNTKFNLYPNPSSGNVFIELNSVSKESPDIITIFDICGKILHRDQIMEEQVVLNVSHLPKGIYMVEVRSSNKRNMQKLLIE